MRYPCEDPKFTMAECEACPDPDQCFGLETETRGSYAEVFFYLCIGFGTIGGAAAYIIMQTS